MELMDKKDERRIVQTLEKVAGDVKGGMHPTAAIIKAAREGEFPAPMLQRMIEATNTAMQLSHFKKTSGTSRADVIPLADPQKVFDAIYPPKMEAPAVKVAAHYVPMEYTKHALDRNFLIGEPVKYEFEPIKVPEIPHSAHYDTIQAFNVQRSLDKQAEFARTEYRLQAEKTAAALYDAADCFNRLYAPAFAEVEKRVFSEYGALGKSCMDTIYERSRCSQTGEKRAEFSDAQYVFDRSKQPFATIANFIEVAGDLVKRAAAYWDAEDRRADNEKKTAQLSPPVKQAADRTLDGLLGRSETPPIKDSRSVGEILSGFFDYPGVPKANFPKAADLGESLLDGGAKALGLSEEKPGPNHEALGAVFDPEHDSEIHAAKARAMLHEFVTTDPIISSHSSEDVSKAFNSISTLAPNLVTQPAVMRGALRKILQQQGVLEPFEADQLKKLDTQLVPAQKDIPATAALGIGK